MALGISLGMALGMPLLRCCHPSSAPSSLAALFLSEWMDQRPSNLGIKRAMLGKMQKLGYH